MRGRGLAGMHGLMRTGVCVALSARGSRVLTEGQGYIGGWGDMGRFDKRSECTDTEELQRVRHV